ncbi:ADP-ribosylglycohydrolase family protein [Variovorax sp. PAMC26660]|uniref:ADP-ribosylglycohydrolase family protein n=1 Tax=Variovorax sp. PAMC26660 TaxID=2762322 RepID=UPI00164E4906|nr:ADP-ribosylglycohydrolase family protein [Variovorax sp. PAMC26660]QNK69746.1 ADP-ribosylglycohydrolase family protein [Variovorax sp. PAMC26660]
MSVVAAQAALSAQVTHAHPEGIAGAVAVALAAAEACRSGAAGHRPSHGDFLGRVVEGLPPSEVRSKLIRAQSMAHVSSLDFPISVLGNGMNMSAQDTVPFALWCCGQALESYQEALWLTVGAGGDRDTLCAIVGGVVASFVGAEEIPSDWRIHREILPEWHLPSRSSS